ncbi:MAG: HPr family phosphocarrier protein [candidate division WOR-3 bacterium]
MKEARVVIPNTLGLHARPASLFVKLAEKFKSKITVEKDGMVVNGKSIMSLLMLVAECGSTLIIKAEGPDEDEAIEALVSLVKDGFGEK